ncbi:MAG: discoidin domain-containing protein [Sedimentisphaerales bacterium]|nr:discoidin domain-containing protein [Sedimentisphaerales bacterium]
MCKQLLLLLMVLGFCVSPVVQGATIIWVGENDDQNGDGVVDDVYWPIWLAEQGYTVDLRRGYWETLNEAKVAELNQADLVIVSRNTDSDAYANGQEVALWNSVTAPMILTTPYLSRSSRWIWVNHTGLNVVAGGPAWSVVDPGHAVFFGMDLNAGDQVTALDAAPPSAGVAHLNGDIGNGVLIASAVSGEAAIVEWEPGIEYNPGGALVAGRRLLFCAGTTEAGGNPQGQFNLTPVGQQMFLNAIKYMLGLDLYAASWPSPADDAEDVRQDAVLTWMPGPTIASHDVYLGTDLDSISTATRANPQGLLVSQAQAGDTYDPTGLLALGQTYYWRIDEVEASGTVHQGEIWSFTVEPYAYPLANVTAAASAGPDPSVLVDGSGLDENGQHSVDTATMWQAPAGDDSLQLTFTFDRAYKLDQMQVWNFNGEYESLLGFGVKNVTLEYSADGETWTVLGDFELAQGPGQATYAGQALDLGGIAAQYVRLTANSNYGANQYALSEVGFLYVPVRAREPQPADGATDVSPDAVLTWRAGREAASHEVYLSTDEQAVIDGTAPAVTVTQSSYAAVLELGQTYYWKVNEVNEATWEGSVWSFSTADYIAVDDMESYTDEDGNLIYEAWVDGFGNDLNGSQVGHDMPPYAEQTNVNSGDQSMPFQYTNTGSATSSEATRTFASPQDWTQGGATTLVVYFAGNPGNAVGQFYVKINGKQVTYTGDATAFTRPLWTQWNIDLASLGVNLKAVNSLVLGVSGSGTGRLFIDDIRLYRSAPAAASEVIWIEAESATSVTVPLEILSDNPDASGGQYLSVMPGNNSMTAPPAEGRAMYSFTVQGGTYKLMARVLVPTADDNSLWLRIPDATTQTTNHSSGWVWWYDASVGSDWHWDDVRSNDDSGAVVQFTLPAGTHTLEVAYREDGLLIDSFVLTDSLD